MSQRPIIVFDVNETLLDLETIRPTFDRIFDDPTAMRRNAPLDVGPQPDYIGNDLDAVADQLIERYPASAMTLATGE